MVRIRLAAACALLAALLVVPAASSRPAGSSVRLAVYLVRGEQVAPVRRVLPGTAGVARAALLAVLRGPTAAERRAGYGSQIPAGTRLRGVSVSAGVATIDLGRRFEAGGGSASMLLRVAQVVHTATQFSSVRRVAFRLDGRPVAAIGGEGVVVDPPVGRADFEAQAPPILVEQPLPGDTVRSPLLVRGTANVFEARLAVEVVTGSGRVLARRHISATAGTGARGRFETKLRLRASPPQLRVIAYANSPKDGSRIHVTRIAVVRRR